MRLDVVRQPLIMAFVTLFVFAVAMMYTANLFPVSISALEPTSLLGGFITPIQSAWPSTAKALSVLLIFLSGAALGRMTMRYSLYPVHTYLAIPLYGFLACGLFIGSVYTVQYLVSALLVLALGRFYACFRSGSYGFGEIFRGSLCLGFLPLIYTPSILLVVAIPLSIVVFKRSVRELLVAMVGYLLPVLTVGYLNWCFGGFFSAAFVALFEAFVTDSEFSFITLPISVLVSLGVLTIFYISAAFFYFRDMYAGGSKSRSILLFNLLLVPVIAAILFMPCASLSAITLLAVPIAVLLPLLFVRLGRWVAWLLYFGLFFLCLLGHFF